MEAINLEGQPLPVIYKANDDYPDKGRGQETMELLL